MRLTVLLVLVQKWTGVNVQCSYFTTSSIAGFGRNPEGLRVHFLSVTIYAMWNTTPAAPVCMGQMGSSLGRCALTPRMRWALPSVLGFTCVLTADVCVSVPCSRYTRESTARRYRRRRVVLGKHERLRFGHLAFRYLPYFVHNRWTASCCGCSCGASSFSFAPPRTVRRAAFWFRTLGLRRPVWLHCASSSTLRPARIRTEVRLLCVGPSCVCTGCQVHSVPAK